MVSLWNGEASSAWVTHPGRYDMMLAPFSQLVLDAARVVPGERVLDVGCGAGQLSLDAAALVGSEGSVVGVDVSAPLLGLARDRRAGSEVAPVTFVEADAQEHGFDELFDVVVSRFGVMFFADPVAAFTNLLQATASTGRLAFVCWQPAPANEWVLAALLSIAPVVGPPKLPPQGAPGPFAFGDAEHVRRILQGAGWAEVDVVPAESTIAVGGASTVEEAVAFYVEDAFGRMLLDGATPAQRDTAAAGLRKALEPHVTDAGVTLDAATWVVTATRAD